MFGILEAIIQIP